MPKDTPSMAKNKIRRCLTAIVDPHPGEADVDLLWRHFESTCAYCGLALDRASRHGHLDHAVSTTSGGSNSIYSHVLACARCNGDEKREEHWDTFLARKCDDPEVVRQRRERIEAWFAAGRTAIRPVDAELQRQAQLIVEEALASFDDAVRRMRQLRSVA